MAVRMTLQGRGMGGTKPRGMGAGKYKILGSFNMGESGMNVFVKLIISALVGIPVALVIYLLFKLLGATALVSGAFSVIVYLIGVIVIAAVVSSKNKTVSINKSAIKSADGIDSKEVKEAVTKGEKKLVQIQTYAQKIKNLDVKKKADRIGAVIQKILQDFIDDPSDVRTARKFLNYYLDTTITILKKYTELSAGGVQDPDMEKTLIKAENMLDTIEAAFNKQLAKLKENDVLDLDTEIEVLDKTLKMEGF